MAAIDVLLKALVQANGSDLHVSAGRPPVLRVHGEIQAIPEYPAIEAAHLEGILLEIMNEENQRVFKEMKDTDFAHRVEGLGRFRVNVFTQMTGLAAVFRVVPSQPPTADDLKLPPAIRKLATLHKGLVLVTGPTGSGKSTTLAAIVDLINKTRSAHILTVEDPVEFVHTPQKCHISQREVGAHAYSFPRALRAALREDPDVVLVGELRDLETMELATTAAETGHLVFGTLHTSSASKTIDRIIGVFPGEKQNQIRGQLAETLKAVVAQQLIKKADGKGRVAAHEIMLSNNAISNHIRQDQTPQIVSVMLTSAESGMKVMERSLADLAKSKAIKVEVGRDISSDKAQFDRYLNGP